MLVPLAATDLCELGQICQPCIQNRLDAALKPPQGPPGRRGNRSPGKVRTYPGSPRIVPLRRRGNRVPARTKAVAPQEGVSEEAPAHGLSKVAARPPAPPRKWPQDRA